MGIFNEVISDDERTRRIRDAFAIVADVLEEENWHTLNVLLEFARINSTHVNAEVDRHEWRCATLDYGQALLVYGKAVEANGALWLENYNKRNLTEKENNLN